jgi:hypothetical protein
MRAFEVYSNNRKLCLAGIGEDGVLTAIVNWVAKKGRGDLFLTVGGLVSPVGEHVNWVRQDLAVGDVITVKIVEASSSDVPRSRKRSNPAEDLRYQKSYVRAVAKKLGWKIQAKAKRSTR